MGECGTSLQRQECVIGEAFEQVGTHIIVAKQVGVWEQCRCVRVLRLLLRLWLVLLARL
jgi:hypothetical protein